MSAARTEIEDEVGVDEIRRQLHNEQLMRDLDKARQEVVDIDININPNSILSDDLKND